MYEYYPTAINPFDICGFEQAKLVMSYCSVKYSHTVMYTNKWSCDVWNFEQLQPIPIFAMLYLWIALVFSCSPALLILLFLGVAIPWTIKELLAQWFIYSYRRVPYLTTYMCDSVLCVLWGFFFCVCLFWSSSDKCIVIAPWPRVSSELCGD